MNQQDIVLQIVRDHPDGWRTEQIKIEAMYRGISCPDRYLRYLKAEGKITKISKEGDATDTWLPSGEAVGAGCPCSALPKFDGEQEVMNI